MPPPPFEPGLAAIPRFLPQALQKRTFGDKWYKFCYGQMSFMSPNQQFKSTEGNSKHQTNQWPGFILFFTYHRTLEVRGAAPFTPALRVQCKLSDTTGQHKQQCCSVEHAQNQQMTQHSSVNETSKKSGIIFMDNHDTAGCPLHQCNQ